MFRYNPAQEEENQKMIDRFFEEHASIHTPLSVTENKNRMASSLSTDGLFKIPQSHAGTLAGLWWFLGREAGVPVRRWRSTYYYS